MFVLRTQAQTAVTGHSEPNHAMRKSYSAIRSAPVSHVPGPGDTCDAVGNRTRHRPWAGLPLSTPTRKEGGCAGRPPKRSRPLRAHRDGGGATRRAGTRKTVHGSDSDGTAERVLRGLLCR
ncbi:hypothetical protein GCM10020367_60200 [Streptomyces sannanensis]|uniref:Uncharacterized protein n=1 Tax=Streptomyces sannanensis TaxID=285536 RepID=A0ABP6SKD1_9ACTN